MNKFFILMSLFCYINCMAGTKKDSLCTDTCITDTCIIDKKCTNEKKKKILNKTKAETLLFKMGPGNNSPMIPKEEWPYKAKVIPLKKS